MKDIKFQFDIFGLCLQTVFYSSDSVDNLFYKITNAITNQKWGNKMLINLFESN